MTGVLRDDAPSLSLRIQETSPGPGRYSPSKSKVGLREVLRCEERLVDKLSISISYHFVDG